MKTGDTITVREHRTAPAYKYQIETIHPDGSLSAVNTVKAASNRKGGFVPRIYLTPTNIDFMKENGWLTEEV